MTSVMEAALRPVIKRSNPSAQHQLLCMIVEEFPEVAAVLAARSGIRIPDYDELSVLPTSYVLKDGNTVHADAVVQFLKGGRPVFFTQVEPQLEYKVEKLATLRSYHGSEVRRSVCGGAVVTVSPKTSVARQFVAEDARYREEFAYRSGHQSGADLAPLHAPGASVQDRLVAVAAADLAEYGAPPETRGLMSELRGLGLDRLADQLVKAILEECKDLSSLEDAMFEAAERLWELPTFRVFMFKREAEVRAETAAEVRAEDAAAALAVAADDLIEYFTEKNDTPSAEALGRIRGCVDPAVLKAWTRRAWRGETSAQIFGDSLGS